MANLLISEVLNNTGKKRGKAEKQKYLKENYSVALITVPKAKGLPQAKIERMFIDM